MYIVLLDIWLTIIFEGLNAIILGNNHILGINYKTVIGWSISSVLLLISLRTLNVTLVLSYHTKMGLNLMQK
jgi:hypothetical protein